MNLKKSLFLTLVLVVSVGVSGALIWHGLNLDRQSLILNQQTDNPQVLGDQAAQVLSSGSPVATSAGSESRFLVTKVVDGDTIQIKYEGSTVSVRLIGIDTPETVDPRRPVGCFGKKASDETKRLLTGKEVILTKDVSETDKYNRLLRYVYLPLSGGDNLFVNDYLVRQGFAKAYTYPPDVKYNERFLAAEKEARENVRGMWSECK